VTELHIDFETRSTVDLKKAGVYVYAEDPTTDLWCAAYCFDDGPVEVWLPGQSCPDDIFEHVITGGIIIAHNANFERIIWKYILAPRYGWPEPEVTQWRCTMVMAYALALPGALKDAAPACGLNVRKDDAGHRLMLQMSKPRKREPLAWWDAPEKVERLIAYCRTDVEVEHALYKRLRPLKQSELDLWHLDQIINDRGAYVDVALCHAAMKVIEAAKVRLDAEMSELTHFGVTACSNRNQLVAWLREQGVETDTVKKAVLEEMVANWNLSPTVKRVLYLRREARSVRCSTDDRRTVVLEGCCSSTRPPPAAGVAVAFSHRTSSGPMKIFLSTKRSTLSLAAISIFISVLTKLCTPSRRCFVA
jgi:DNA polymerase